MVIATVAEFASRVQQDVDTATATLLLELAEDLIVAETGILTPWPARVKGVQLDAATRAYVNPAGVNHELFETYTRSGIPPGGVYLTADERRTVRLASGKTAGLVSARLVSPSENAGNPLYDVPAYSDYWL